MRKHLVSVPQQTNHDPHSKYTNQSNPSKPVGVIGEFAGGSLAASLALTECHSYKPGAIKAAALGNAVVDWSSPFQNSDSDAHEEEVMERDLLSLRSRAFSRPADRYDPFASPLLFFRTPAWELVPEPVLYGFPPSSSASASASASSPVSNENDDSELARDTTSSSPAASKQEGKGEEELIPKWRSHRKYPPLGSGLRLPQTRIEICTSGGGGVLREQGMEMAELMQRSVDVLARDDHGFEMASQGGEREGRWKRRVELVEREGRGGGRGMLWGEKEMVEVGAWIGEALRSR